MKRIESSQKARIIIKPNLAAQIEMLHNQCPEDQEWSGLLVAKITKGGIEDVENLEISAESCFLMDFGDTTFTSFEGNAEDYLKFFDQYPQIDPVKKEKDSPWFIGKIHSHHSMKSFHSQIDTADLYENAPKLPFFLSLVVNYACNPFAEIAVAGTYKEAVITETRWSLNSWTKKSEVIVPKETTEPLFYIIPASVHYENQAVFIEQINSVRDREKTVTTYGKGSGKDKKEEKEGLTRFENPSAVKYDQKVYNRLMSTLSDLLTLGLLSSTTPAEACTQVDRALEVSIREKYCKAVKYFFWHEWYDSNFYNIPNCDEEAVIACLDRYLSFQSNGWLLSVLKQISRELKTELTVLRQVQGSTLV